MIQMTLWDPRRLALPANRFMSIREAHVRNYALMYASKMDQIDDAIPLNCGGEKPSDTARRLGLLE